MAIFVVLSGCDGGPNKPAIDNLAPDPITSLSAVQVSSAMVRLTWIATGDNGSKGRATSYDVRCSTVPIVDFATWDDALFCDGEPLPSQPGDSEHFVFTSLLPASKYFFCVRALDEVGNQSGLSNLDSAHLLPLFAEPLRTASSYGSENFKVADIDNDGDSDVVKFDYWEGIGILTNDGHGQLTPQPEIAFTRMMGDGDVGDLDGDDDLDIVTISSNLDSLFIFTQIAPGVLVIDTAWYLFDGPHGVAIADFNNDSRNDLALIGSSVGLQIYLNAGNGQFMLTDQDATGIAPYNIAQADLDGDGYIDLAVSNYYSSSISVYHNNSLGSFDEVQRPSAGQIPDGIVIANLNEDEFPDVAVTNRFTELVTVLYGSGYGWFGPYMDTCSATGMCRAISAADLDGDGDIDLALANETINGITLLLNAVWPRSFAAPLQLEEPHDCFDVEAVDMDGDGDIDLVAGWETISVYLNNSVISDSARRRSAGDIARVR
ncbi:MAG: VCBS repeat-containing protein [bacterium]|nr:VCBS repeat-containing protein [bacterium]